MEKTPDIANISVLSFLFITNIIILWKKEVGVEIGLVINVKMLYGFTACDTTVTNQPALKEHPYKK